MIAGRRLADSIASGPLPAHRLASIGSELTTRVAAAHAVGDVVGMLSSTNLFITTRGDITILDAAYAPISGRRRDDLFALGVLLYAMATGVSPFVGSPRGLATPRSPAAINPRLPPGLVQVIERAVHPNPERRFSSAVELSAALAEVLRAPGSLESLLPAKHVSSTAAVKPPPRPPDEERLGAW